MLPSFAAVWNRLSAPASSSATGARPNAFGPRRAPLLLLLLAGPLRAQAAHPAGAGPHHRAHHAHARQLPHPGRRAAARARLGGGGGGGRGRGVGGRQPAGAAGQGVPLPGRALLAGRDAHVGAVGALCCGARGPPRECRRTGSCGLAASFTPEWRVGPLTRACVCVCVCVSVCAGRQRAPEPGLLCRGRPGGGAAGPPQRRGAPGAAAVAAAALLWFVRHRESDRELHQGAAPLLSALRPERRLAAAGKHKCEACRTLRLAQRGPQATPWLAAPARARARCVHPATQRRRSTGTRAARGAPRGRRWPRSTGTTARRRRRTAGPPRTCTPSSWCAPRPPWRRCCCCRDVPACCPHAQEAG